jgi:hemerythrin
MDIKNEIDLVTWEDKYVTGIQLIDDQHKELFSLTNELFNACIGRNDYETLDGVFKDTMERMVDYVRFHFSAEQVLLQRINYPEYQEHKKEHDTLVIKILEAVKEYNEGKKLVPNQFVRTLRDWILSHIALSDQLYVSYVTAQKKKGLLGDRELNG